MNAFVVLSQYYIYAVIFFTYRGTYVQSFPFVPGREFEQCFEFLGVFEDDRSVEPLGFADGDFKHICALQNTRGKSLCFVVTTFDQGSIESACHEFDLLDLRITHFKYPSLMLEIVVFQDGYTRWYFYCAVNNYDEVKEFYSFMMYDSYERRLRGLDRTIDLQKRAAGAFDYEAFATKPSIYIDESVANSSIVHVVDSRAAGRGPLLIMLQGTFDIHTPEDRKVYMSLRRYTEELYFFTCASSRYADQLSYDLAKYSHHRHATARTSPVLLFY